MARRFSTSVPFSEGGTATLYTAHDLVLGRAVVLKVPHATGSDQIERTFREARALAAVHHPGVCQVYEVGFEEGRPFIALEKVEGSPLGELASKLDRHTAIELVAEVAEAVQAIHDAGVIHRDLKPDNVVVRVTTEGRLQPVVVDFGLVRFTGDQPAGSTAGLPLGTPGFMAPELVLGDPDRIDPRTDVYGLGAILYFLLTGRPVFTGEAAAEVMFRTLHEEPRPPSDFVPDLAPELQAVVLKCLDSAPARRYATAREVALDLRRQLAGQPVAAPRRGPVARAWRRFARSRARLWTAGILTVLALGTAGAVTWDLLRHHDQRTEWQRWADDIEWRLRAEYLAPRHDVSHHERTVRERVAAAEQELAHLRRGNRAHAHLAVGRVLVALGDDRSAEPHLRAAWDAGRNEPEVAYLLGLTLSRQFEQGLKRAAWSFDSTLGAARRTVLERDLRDPARAFLNRADGAQLPVPTEYPLLLIAAHEGRFDEALRWLAELRQRVPWFYEAWITEGSVLQVRGIAAYVEGDLPATLESFEAAHRAYAQAKTAGQSDPRVYEGLCVTAADSLGLRQELERPVDPAEITALLALCDEALEVSPEHPGTLASVAWAHEFAARSHDDTLESARQRIDRAVTLGERAVAAGPENAAHLAILCAALSTSLRLGDQHPTAEAVQKLEATATALERRLVDEPGSLDRLLLVHSFLFLEIYRASSFAPPTPRHAEILRSIDEISATRHRSFRVPWELAMALGELSQARDVFGEGTAELDDRAVLLAEQALMANPDMADVVASVFETRWRRALLRCARLEPDDGDAARVEEMLNELAARRDRPEVAARRARTSLGEAACAIVRGGHGRAQVAEARRHIATAGRLGAGGDLERSLRLVEWRALASDPATSPRELRAALREPLPERFTPTPQALLASAQTPLTLAELALRARESPRPYLDEAAGLLAEVGSKLPDGGRRPVALDRLQSVLAFLTARAQENPDPAEIGAAGRRLLALPLAGSRADIGWHFWRHQTLRVLAADPDFPLLSGPESPGH